VRDVELAGAIGEAAIPSCADQRVSSTPGQSSTVEELLSTAVMQRANATAAGSVLAALAEGARCNISTFTSTPVGAAP
jgi:hypothetical protein